MQGPRQHERPQSGVFNRDTPAAQPRHVLDLGMGEDDVTAVGDIGDQDHPGIEPALAQQQHFVEGKGSDVDRAVAKRADHLSGRGELHQADRCFAVEAEVAGQVERLVPGPDVGPYTQPPRFDRGFENGFEQPVGVSPNRHVEGEDQEQDDRYAQPDQGKPASPAHQRPAPRGGRGAAMGKSSIRTTLFIIGEHIVNRGNATSNSHDDCFYLDPCVVEAGAGSDVGQGVGSQGVGGRPVLSVVGPQAFGQERDPGPQVAADLEVA